MELSNALSVSHRNTPEVFFLFARQRSGTGALNSLIEQHPNVVCTWEVFHPDDRGIFSWWSFIDSVYKRWSHSDFFFKTNIIFDNYMEYCIKTAKKMKENQLNYDRNLKIVFDIKYDNFYNIPISDVHCPAIVQQVLRNKIKVINLTRNNLFEAYISLKNAEKTGQWHVQDVSTLRNKLIDININDMKRTIQFWENEDKYLNSIFCHIKDFLQFDYNNAFMLGNLSPSIVGQLENFLSIQDLKNYVPTIIKQIWNPREVIRNISEVEDALQSIGHIDWLK